MKQIDNRTIYTSFYNNSIQTYITIYKYKNLTINSLLFLNQTKK